MDVQANSQGLRAERGAIKPLWIGSVCVDPPVLQAPMAGFTNYAFRQLVRHYGGAGLLATEMISARSFAWQQEERGELPERLWGVRDEPRPLAVQIWDNNPDTLARVGQRLARDFRVSVVDINFGCPVREVTERARSGSYLLRDPDRVAEIVHCVAQACAPTPVTAKIRLGCSREQANAGEVAEAVERAGAAALTVHGRTADQMFRGVADWEAIGRIRPHLKSIPLIGNGDLCSARQVVEVLQAYPINGVMVARAALGRPWLFRQIAAALRGDPIPPDPSAEEERDCLLHHYELVRERFGDEKGTMLMRKYACCYAQGRPGARIFRTHVATVTDPRDFREVVERFFPGRISLHS